MLSRRAFSATNPSTPPARDEPAAPVAAHVPPPSPDFLLAGMIGSELSGPLAAINQVLDEFTRTRGITSQQMKQLRASVAMARSVAMQSQQIARLAGGRLRQSHERLKLDDMLRDALQDRRALFAKRGVELRHKLGPIEVIVDAGLLSSLIDAAIEWAMAVGRRLTISLEMKNWPEHGLLLVKVSDSVGGPRHDENRDEQDTVGWVLLTELARAMGVPVERATSSFETSVLLTFPRTVKQLEGLTAVEVDTGYDSMFSNSQPLAGHRILVISEDEKLGADIKLVARGLSLMVDFVPTTWQAVRFCELDTPHMVIIDERVRDHIFDELRSDLKHTDPNYPFVEIASQSNTLEIAGWMSDSMTRLSRDALRSQLPSILTLELAKVM